MIEVSNHTSHAVSENASFCRARHFGAGIVVLFQSKITMLCESWHSPEGQPHKAHSAAFRLLDLDPLGLRQRALHSTLSVAAETAWEV